MARMEEAIGAIAVEAMQHKPDLSHKEALRYAMGLVDGFRLGSPGAFAGMLAFPVDADGGAVSLAREALALDA